jgi:hypothetical protein
MLVEEFRISPSVVDLALRKQIQNRLHLLENLTDAQVHFRVTLRPPRGSMQEKPLLAPEFLHGRKRARDREVWSSSDRPSDRVQTAQNDAARAHALRVLGLSGNESVDEVPGSGTRLPGARRVVADVVRTQCKILSAASCILPSGVWFESGKRRIITRQVSLASFQA